MILLVALVFVADKSKWKELEKFSLYFTASSFPLDKSNAVFQPSLKFLLNLTSLTLSLNPKAPMNRSFPEAKHPLHFSIYFIYFENVATFSLFLSTKCI